MDLYLNQESENQFWDGLFLCLHARAPKVQHPKAKVVAAEPLN
jgi:hypothetical protein